MIDRFLELMAGAAPLTEELLSQIREIYRSDPPNFLVNLSDARLVPELPVIQALSGLYAIPFEERLSTVQADHTFTSDVSIQFLKKFCLVPLIQEHGKARIVVCDPSDFGPADDLKTLTGRPDATLALSTRSQIFSAINSLYNQRTDSAQQLVDTMESSSSAIIQEIEQTADLLDDTSDAPVIRLVNHMISQSVKANASDIHIEPFQDSLNIRYRLDGILYDMISPPKWIQSALISRIKVMASMDIAEKRVPQDGRIEVRIGDQEIDIRVSTVPTSFGERLVMRLLNKSGTLLKLSEFGISAAHYETIQRLIHLSNGFILVTGPTGSGKTTTLYAALSEINSPDKNIITIEDPVEYNLKGIGQIQVNRKIGVTFARGLRSIVRQDPDVILVGEIRDLETAEIAIQSALTGHLVFSTLHTNDSPGAVTRLRDLGVESYLITSSLKAVIAQRLVRVLCNHCKKEEELSPREISLLGLRSGAGENGPIFRPVGCSECFHTGYLGREAIFEIMEIDDELKQTILATSDANRIKAVAMKKGMTTLRANGIEKVRAGTTSVEEVLRVTQD